MRKKAWLILIVGVVSLASVLAYTGVRRSMAHDWRTASRESIGTAPDPATTAEAVVQVYAARAWSWRGALGVHSWISVKPTNATQYTVYEVIGWRARRGMSAVSIGHRPPDGRWFGAEPDLLADYRGDSVDGMIDAIDAAAKTYPHAHEYRVWPGPNSNTFIAHVVREVPELKVDLPPTAIGKDYLPNGGFLAKAPSGTGYQLSLFGLFGVLVGVEEGLEVNLLGLTFGIDAKDPALKLPGVGRVGVQRSG